MAPEQLAGREVTLRSDIYSLGLVLYEIFTGKPAFHRKSAAEIAQVQQGTVPTSPSSLVSAMDEIVEQVILRCLEKEPRARPMSALAVSAALPGGDPLAAALAAGETPSPEMVAEAGAAGGLRPLVAIGALVAVVVTVALAIFNAQQTSLHGTLPLDTRPGELAARSLQILDGLGIEEPGPHRRWGFDAYNDYLKWLDENDKSVTRWQRLESKRPPGGRFWFRYSSAEMNPDDVHGFFVSVDDPAQHLPGQGRLLLDLQGRLLGLDIVPPERIEADAEAVDWPVLFDAAGFDLADFEETDPVRAPSTPCDELRAWSGPVYGDVAGIVQVGRVGGAPTYFEILGPWKLGEETPAEEGVAGLVFGLILISMVASAVFLARRNLRAGRSDRKGTIKVMMFFVIAVVGVWFLTEVRLETFVGGSLFSELVFGRLMGHGLLHALLVGLFYVALEPYVRRLWPETLVSWSRLLLGRVRDPLVGRDLLLGMAAIGLLWAISSWVGHQLPGMLEISRPLGFQRLAPGLSGMRYALAMILIDAETAVTLAMAILVSFLLLRLLLRRTWAAVVAALLLATFLMIVGSAPSSMPTELMLFGLFSFLLATVVTLACMLRLGLLSVIGALFMTHALGSAPLTWNLSNWYAGAGLVSVIAVLALAFWAFYISLAGRRLFGDSLFGDGGVGR